MQEKKIENLFDQVAEALALELQDPNRDEYKVQYISALNGMLNTLKWLLDSFKPKLDQPKVAAEGTGSA